MSASPNPLAVAWSVWRSLTTVRRPRPTGTGHWDHDALAAPLRSLRDGGTRVLPDLVPALEDYLAAASTAHPDSFGHDEALAYWINVYNAGALLLAAGAMAAGTDTVLRIPGGFARPFVTIDGEELSLDAVEHAKVRRLGDPRIHAALVCGSVSCPTLRSEPYRGAELDVVLDDQLRTLLAGGAAMVDQAAERISLSKIFLWYGADFVRPHRMPTFVPARRRAVLDAVSPWLDPDVAAWVAESTPSVTFQPYDWGLACTVR